MSGSENKTEQKKIPSSHVRFTEHEFNMIQKMQQTTGLSIPDILKKATFRRIDLLRPLLGKDDVEKVMVELRRQGNNLNQIAKQINSGLMTGWSQSFNCLVRTYVDIRHLISVNNGNSKA
jgi:hypothetical protein